LAPDLFTVYVDVDPPKLTGSISNIF